jgi:hypothetical protein
MKTKYNELEIDDEILVEIDLTKVNLNLVRMQLFVHVMKH